MALRTLWGGGAGGRDSLVKSGRGKLSLLGRKARNMAAFMPRFCPALGLPICPTQSLGTPRNARLLLCLGQGERDGLGTHDGAPQTTVAYKFPSQSSSRSSPTCLMCSDMSTPTPCFRGSTFVRKFYIVAINGNTVSRNTEGLTNTDAVT